MSDFAIKNKVVNPYPDAEVAIKKLKYELQALTKEKTRCITAATNLDKQYGCITEESQ